MAYERAVAISARRVTTPPSDVAGWRGDLVLLARSVSPGRLAQVPAFHFRGGQQTSGANQPLDGFKVSVQGAVAAERPDVLADMQVGRLDPFPRAQRLQKLQSLRGAEQLAGQHPRGIDDDAAAFAGRGGAHRY